MPIKAVTQLEHTSGLAADRVTNTFAIRTGSTFPNLANLVLIAEAVDSFFRTDYDGAGSAIGNKISDAISRTALAHLTLLYDVGAHLDGSNHGSPVYFAPWSLPAPQVATSYPSEVACAVTLEAVGREDQPVETEDGPDENFVPDRPRQRYTGRLYIGPLNTNAGNENPPPQFQRPSLDFLTDLRSAVISVDEALKAIDPEYGIGVWSRTDGAMRALGAVSTDDVFDTIRSRGEAPTARTRTLVA